MNGRCKERCIFITAVVSILLLAFYTWLQSQYQTPYTPDYAQPLRSSYYTWRSEEQRQAVLITASKPKLILMWTKYFDSPFPYYLEGTRQFKYLACPVSNCEFTNDRLRAAEADALIFHFHKKNFFLEDAPKFRDQHQRYIFLLQESPLNTVPNLFNVADFFNWTMTYRLDSDIVYGYDNVLATGKLKDNYIGRKSKMVAWFVSECSTHSEREHFVKKLRQFLPVDIYGRCGELSCPKSDRYRCLNMLEKDYKFYLSFENSLCRDYVTEKFFRMINRDIIPIVMSLGNYSAMVPPQAVINVMDYETVEQLAKHIIRIGSNNTLYNGHFAWRRQYAGYNFNGADGNPYCSLCRKLNDPDEPSKVYSNMYRWWRRGQCVRRDWT